MKKRIIGLLAIIALVFGIAGTLVACKEETASYSITVLSPAEDPLEGITVSWMAGSKVAGSAKTNADGKATAELPLSTYTVQLSGYEEGLTYDPAKPTATQRNLFMSLSVQQVEYSVTVLDEDGAGVANVGVTWSNASGDVAGSTTTNSSGKAAKTLVYGNYSVTLSDLPEGMVIQGEEEAKSVTGKSPSASFTLESGITMKYSVKVQSEGGLLFAKRYNEGGELIDSNSVSVTVQKNGNLFTAGKTDENGEFVFSAKPGTYTARLGSVPAGYSNPGSVTLTEGETEKTFTLKSSIRSGALEKGKSYLVGDIIHDYRFTTTYKIGDTIWSKSLSELFNDGKEVVIINNWGVNCSWCMKEMPFMQTVYEEYQDVIEMIGVNNFSGVSDSVADIEYYAETYTFPMMQDKNGFVEKFNLSNWPTTIIIDRYGAIARIESGAVMSVDAWVRLIEKYIGTDYRQTFTPGVPEESINNEIAKPDVDLPDNHYQLMAEAMNGSPTFADAGALIEWYGDTWEYAWPFLFADANTRSEVLEELGSEVPVLFASSSGKANSTAMLHANVQLKKGMVLTFDYYSDTEAYYDGLTVLWDGRIIKEITGKSDKWITCYLYSEILDTADDEYHALDFIFMKDDNDDEYEGKDNVYIRNIRFVDLMEDAELLAYLEEGSVDMFRSAGYGPITQEGHFSYYVEVELNEDDGYYYVDLKSLQNSSLAGTDEKPMLFVNLLGLTPWHSDISLVQLMGGVDEDGKYIYSCEFDIGDGLHDYRDDLYDYALAAQASYIPYCVPVDETLQKLLVKFMAEVSGEYSHAKEWLEVCGFYSHYGAGDPVNNPIKGVMDRTAIKIEAGQRYTADLTRDIDPFPKTRFQFTPTTSGVYKIESFIPDDDAGDFAAQLWLYDASSIELARKHRGTKESSDTLDYALFYDGDARIHFGRLNEQNFEVYYYMTAGHEYYLALALLPPLVQTGTYEFELTYVDTEYSELTRASDDFFTMILDDDENMTGIILSGAIDYELDEDGYYYALDEKGQRSGKIYLDTKYPRAMLNYSISYLTDKKIYDPIDKDVELFGFFDFSKCTVYHSTRDADGYEYVTYKPIVDISSQGEKYKDYTNILKGYCEGAGEDGLIPITQELVDILTLLQELRVDMIFCPSNNPTPLEVVNSIEKPLDNEWLRFCWYYKTHNETTP